MRHTFSHQYLADNPGDLVGLAQILGHENLNTTKRCVQQSQQQLSEAAELLTRRSMKGEWSSPCSFANRLTGIALVRSKPADITPKHATSTA